MTERDIHTPEPPQRILPLEEPEVGKANGKKLGLALVGLGSYATGQLLPAIEQSQYFDLKAIVTGSPEKARRYSEKYMIPQKGIYNYKNFDSIIENQDVDVIYIVLPNSLHAEYTIRAAKAGKHVICEKPMATSVEDCERMIEACKEANRLLFIGYRLHYEPYNLEAMRIGQYKTLGQVKKIQASFGFDVGESGQWRLKKEMAGGGSLVDVGIYTIQAARYITGKEPIAIRSAKIIKSENPKFNEVENEIKWEMEFPDGVIATCFASYTKEVDRLYAEASRGWFELEPAFEYSGQQGRTLMGEMNFPSVNQQALQLEGMAETILNGRENRATGEEGLQDVKIIQAIYECEAKGEPVHMEESHEHIGWHLK